MKTFHLLTKILIATDKFKGSATAAEVCAAISSGIKATNPETEIVALPMADGGDGSLEVLSQYLNLEKITLSVSDPLGRTIDTYYFMDGKSAYVELAAASGLVLLTPAERNPLITSTYGTGELCLDAIKKGALEIILFIGGSATNDAGLGIAAALGYHLLDRRGNELPPTGSTLAKIHTILPPHDIEDLKKVHFKVICDVNNPFWGPEGAAHSYAEQKGASAIDIKELDGGLHHLSEIIKNKMGIDLQKYPGSGAAGGVGGGMIAFFGAELVSGTTMFMHLSKMEEKVVESDLIITGEGSLDLQSSYGKVMDGVSRLAHKHHKAIMAVCGHCEGDAASEMGISHIYTVLEKATDFDDAMTSTSKYLYMIGREIGELLGR